MRDSGPGRRSDNGQESQPLMVERQWENLPRDLLIDIIGRAVSSRDTSLSARKAIVASASVCRSWRETVVKDIVRTPEQSGLITLTASLKQPGPRNRPIQCFIRVQKGNYYRLFLGLNPDAVRGRPTTLLLAARRVATVTGIDYLISLGTSQANNDYLVGKLSSNFFGTNFSVYDHSQKKTPPKFLLSKLLSFENHENVMSIDYDRDFRKPRRMHCTVHDLPASAAPDQDNRISRNTHTNAPTVNKPMVLTTKPSKWNENLKCWCANYYGRVTKASIKNFQLVEADDPSPSGVQEQESAEREREKIILQFGKIGKNRFTMDYKYPLSAFQAFAICLSGF